MNKKILFMLPLLLSSMNFPAFADDGKVYSASQCLPADYSAHLGVRFHDGRLSNVYETRKVVICPIIRDLAGSKKIISNIRIVVVDNNYGAGDPKVQCGIYSRTSSGGYVDSAWVSSKPGASALVQELSIPTNIKSANNLLLRCHVPGYDVVDGKRWYSSLLSYRLTERKE